MFCFIFDSTTRHGPGGPGPGGRPKQQQKRKIMQASRLPPSCCVLRNLVWFELTFSGDWWAYIWELGTCLLRPSLFSRSCWVVAKSDPSRHVDESSGQDSGMSEFRCPNVVRKVFIEFNLICPNLSNRKIKIMIHQLKSLYW